jgi:hypothetical protein
LSQRGTARLHGRNNGNIPAGIDHRYRTEVRPSI